jgi:Uma2 family endonuclease
MAQPVRSSPAPLPLDLGFAEDDEDFFVFGWRYGRFRRADGGVEIREIPLSAEDLLNPRVGDHVVQNNRHAELSILMYNLLERRYEATVDVMVCFDMKIRWGIRGLKSPAPDVAVIPGVRDKEKFRRSFHVRQEGALPALVIEVVSGESEDDEQRIADYEKKVEIYERAGVPEYMIVDPQVHLERPLLCLTGYRLDARGRYRPIEPDDQGRLLVETVGLWFAVAPDDRDLWLIDAATGERLLSPTEIEAARQAAEERAAREAETRRAAEDRADRETEARRAAEAELARLRQQLGISEP